jgi:hypothetical protein
MNDRTYMIRLSSEDVEDLKGRNDSLRGAVIGEILAQAREQERSCCPWDLPSEPPDGTRPVSFTPKRIQQVLDKNYQAQFERGESVPPYAYRSTWVNEEPRIALLHRTFEYREPDEGGVGFLLELPDGSVTTVYDEKAIRFFPRGREPEATLRFYREQYTCWKEVRDEDPDEG